MNSSKYLLYLFVMASVTYLIRVLPLILVRKKIENRFISSFLYYIPYAVLGCMTFPMIIYSTNDICSGIAGTVTGLFFAYRKKGLLYVALSAVLVVLMVKTIAGFV